MILFLLLLQGITSPTTPPPRRALKCPSAAEIKQQGLEAAFHALFITASAKQRAGDHQGAIDYFRAALAALPADPQSAPAWNDMGWSLLQVNRPADAVVAFKKALELNPDLERAKNNLAMAEK